MNPENPMTEYLCPCCGSKLPAPPDVKVLTEVPLRGIGLQIVKALVRAYPGGIAWDEIYNAAYSGARVPDTAYQVIATRLTDLRRILRPYGWTIPPIGQVRGAAKYRLQALDAKAA